MQLGVSAAPLDTLKRFLVSRHLLLLLDNFEHLLEASPIVGELLAEAPQLSVLATSRECLHLYGEQEYLVSPLKLPNLNNHETPEQLLTYEAIDLFFQRAKALQPSFPLDETQAYAVAQICLRLDGLPLTIELAASQLKIFPPNLLAKQFETGLSDLASGPHDFPERQRTLQATIAWSYNLLNTGEKTLFARLAVFSGGGTLEAIQEICGEENSSNLVNKIYALVEKSLLIPRQGSDGELHFTMLETIHEFADQYLSASGELEDIRHRHARYYTLLVEKGEPEFRTLRKRYWYARFQAEQGNLQAALSWSLNGDQVEYGLRLDAALRGYWCDNGLGVEGQRWSELAVARSENAAPQLRVGVLHSAGDIANLLGDLHRARELLSQTIDLYRSLGEDRKAARAMTCLVYSFSENAGDYAQGVTLGTQALDLCRKFDDQLGIANALYYLGELARLQGEDEAAWDYYEESLAICKQTGDRYTEPPVYNNMSYIAYHQKKYELANELAQQSLRILNDLNAPFMMACSIRTLAGPAAALGKLEYAANLLGISHEIYVSLGCWPPASDQIEHDKIDAAVRKQLGEAEFQRAFQSGQAMPVQEIIPFALEEVE